MAIICRDHKLLFIQVPATGCSSISKVLLEELGGEKLPGKDIMLGTKYKLMGEKHNTLKQLVEFNLISQTELRSYTTFGTVRNPFDRFASAYQRYLSCWWEKMIESEDPNCPANRVGELHRQRYVKNVQKQIQLARDEGFEKWLTRKILLPQSLDLRIKQGFKRWLRKQPVFLSKSSIKMNVAYPFIEGVDRIIRYEHLEQDFNQILNQAGVNEYIPLPHTNKTPGKKSYQAQYSPQARTLVERELAQELARFNYTFDGLDSGATSVQKLDQYSKI
ncbi:MAG: sulfotransferase family 2 domain-containing protein [Cyanobacteria bacterium P01_G01_bin.19]